MCIHVEKFKLFALALRQVQNLVVIRVSMVIAAAMTKLIAVFATEDEFVDHNHVCRLKGHDVLDEQEGRKEGKMQEVIRDHVVDC